MSITRIGAWVDRRGVGPDWREWLDVAREIGLTDVSLVLHAQDAGRPFAPFATSQTVARIAMAYRAAGITPHVMLWPQPRESHCRALLAYLHRRGRLSHHHRVDVHGPPRPRPRLRVHPAWRGDLQRPRRRLRRRRGQRHQPLRFGLR